MAKGDAKSKADSLVARQAAEAAAKLVDIRSQIKGFDTRAWFVETLKYAAWVIIFTMSIFANRGTANQYNYVDLWRAQARAGIPEPFATKEHFWQMIEDSMVPMLGPAALVESNDDGNATGYFTYPSSEGDYGLAYKSPLNANESITRLAWNGNVIVDGIWIRQLRTSSVNCSKFGNLAQVSAAFLFLFFFAFFCFACDCIPRAWLHLRSFHCRRRCRVSQLGHLTAKKSSTRNCPLCLPATAATSTQKSPWASNMSISPLTK